MPLSAEQIAFLTDVLKLDPKLVTGTGMYVPIDKAGAALKTLGGGEAPPLDDANGANGEDLSFQRTGPMVSIPANEDGSPARMLEINAGAKDTDLGLPPDPITGEFVDPNLIDLTRTDYNARPGASQLDANAPIPREMQGQFDTVFSNNPHGYQPDLGNVAGALKPGGRIIMQGRSPANRDFQKVMDKVAPAEGPPNPPDGMRVVEASRNLESADIMGSNFNKTSGEPVFKGPNARLILEKTAETAREPGATPRPPSEAPLEMTAPEALADSGASSSEAAAEGAGLGGAAEAGVLGGAIAGGMALYDDIARVRSDQMSVGDAAVDVGSKTGEVGGLTIAGKLLADTAGAGGRDAAAAAGGGDALAGAAGDATGAGLGAAGAGGIIGGVVAGGMALISDVGKVEDGTMTGGHAAVDVTAKTAVGVGAGVAGAVAGAEIGAAVGSIIPGAGTAVGLVAGAVVGGAVGYVGNALTNTETGQVVLNAAGDAVDTAIDGVKVAGHAIGDAASTAGSAIGDAASVMGGAVSDAANAAVDAASSAANAVGDAASSAASAVGDAANAVSDAASSAVGAIRSVF
jgi:hypothetical protein